jgi:hypothetical protein
MIPLGYFLIAWLVLLAVNAILVLLTLMQMLRHGLPSAFTYLSTLIFVAVIAAVVMGSGLYFMNVNWDVSVNVVPGSLGALFGGSPDSTLIDIPLEQP